MFGKIILIGIPLIILLAFAIVWGGYKRLINLQQAVRNALSQVQNAYQRRFDLVPNIVAAVDSFMKRQQQTLTGVIELRQRVVTISEQAAGTIKNATVDSLDQIGKQLNQSVGSFINAVHEAYPDIKGDVLFQNLIAQLETTESTIFNERMAYNLAVKAYNQARQATLGGLAGGGIFNLSWEENFFQGDDKAQHAPSVADAFNG